MRYENARELAEEARNDRLSPIAGWLRCARNSGARVWTASSCRAPTSIWANTCRPRPNGLRGSPASPAAPGWPRCWPTRRRCSPTDAMCCSSPPRPIPALWERLHITEDPPPAWLAANAPEGAKIGYDPLLISEEGLARYTEAGLAMQPVTRNPIDAVWTDRPAPPLAPARPHPLEHAGRSAAEKREQIAALLREAKQDAAVLSDPASIAWLLNIRGGDVPFTPFALGFALTHADGGTELFMDPAKLPDATREWLGNTVSVAGREALEPALARLAGKRVRVDASGTPVWFAQTLREAGAVVVAGPDPCLLPKACKNEVEQQGSRNAHAARCGGRVPVPALSCGDRPDAAARPRCPRLRSCLPCAEDGRRVPRRELSGDLGRGRARCHHPLSRDRGEQPADPAQRGLSDRFRRAVPGRHDRHHPHRLDRAGRSAGGIAGAGHARAEGPYRDRHPGVSRRASAARIWMPSHGVRCGRRGWTTIMAPATGSAAICRSTRGR